MDNLRKYAYIIVFPNVSDMTFKHHKWRILAKTLHDEVLSDSSLVT